MKSHEQFRGSSCEHHGRPLPCRRSRDPLQLGHYISDTGISPMPEGTAQDTSFSLICSTPSYTIVYDANNYDGAIAHSVTHQLPPSRGTQLSHTRHAKLCTAITGPLNT
ncbi:uncharacterized protein LOC124903164 [Homo sapiens]|uniref:uncharacterized protein LOC124903164 n=1 Tax=Homo sapiens TaxID=9606 RepID=UPI001FB0EA27|nr:uncharacterized protein LOC124903164 [Homo sapiens]XP_047302190.1 uncharacterized protein LOC124903164 [Homo sapiens]